MSAAPAPLIFSPGKPEEPGKPVLARVSGFPGFKIETGKGPKNRGRSGFPAHQVSRPAAPQRGAAR